MPHNVVFAVVPYCSVCFLSVLFVHFPIMYLCVKLIFSYVLIPESPAASVYHMLYLFTCIILYCDFCPLWYCGQNIESDRICSLSLIFSVLIFCIHISYNIAIFRVKATYLILFEKRQLYWPWVYMPNWALF